MNLKEQFEENKYNVKLKTKQSLKKGMYCIMRHVKHIMYWIGVSLLSTALYIGYNSFMSFLIALSAGCIIYAGILAAND